MDEEEDKFQMDLAYYMEIGAVNLVGMDETGQAVYEITEIAKEIAPELWEAHIDYVDRSLTELFEAGLINVEYNEDLEAIIHMTPEGYQAAKEYGLINLEDEE